ncbi:MAG: hypothetical protein HYU57_06430 [Micavibrio aeruginosavorus]|nr:hypothetical protein [Micavibrio aeruginosavorus]
MADQKPDEEKGGFLSGAASVAKWGFKAFIWDTDDSLGANLVKVGLTAGSVVLIPFSAGGSLAARGAITAGAVATKVPAVANVLSKTGLVAARTVAKEGAELAAKTAVKAAAKEGAEAAVKTGAKVAAEAVVKKTRLTGASEEALSALKAAKEAGEAARAGGQAAAKVAAQSADDVARATAKTATTSTAQKAGVEAAEVAAGAGSKLGFWQARHILKSDNLSLAEKLTQLSKGGRGDYCEKLLMQARKEGLKASDIDLIRKADGIPAALKTKFETLHTLQSAGGVSAKVDQTLAYTLDAAKHPLRTGKDLLTAQVTVPVAALKLANQHRIMTAGVVAGGAALHGATDGASTRAVGDAAHAVGSAYWSVDKFLAGTALNIGAAGMNAISPESAEAFVKSTGQIAEDVAKQTPSFLLSLSAHAAGTTPEEITKDPVKFAEEHPILNFMLPAPVRHAVTGAKIADKVNNKDANGPAPAAGDGTMTQVPGQTLAERAQGAVDKAREVKDAAEEKLLGDLDIPSMMADPKAAWDKVKLAAEKNPQLKKLVEIGENHPYMKYGIMAGMAYGALTNEGNRLAGAIKGALIFGILGDLIGTLFGQKSFVLDKIREIRNSNSAVPGFETPRPSTHAAPAPRQQSRGVDGPGIVSDARPREDFGKNTAVQPAPVVAQAPSSEDAAPGADRRRRFQDYEMQRSPMGSNTPALTPVPSLGG